MHGRIKTRTTEEKKEIAKKEKAKKATVFKTSITSIFEKRKAGIYDQEVLNLSANLLNGNPDIITLWNYRREIFLILKNQFEADDYQKLLEKDLSLTENCLRVNPKSYGSWHHRIWVLDNLPSPDWKQELVLCTKYLKLDERNFHCWDYRRTVAERSNVPNSSEYQFTLDKIETNFSNYSAWHLRSKLLPKIFPDKDKKFPIDEVKHKEELELVENAAFTDPNDQSAWFYLRWLLDLKEPKPSFVHLKAENEILIVTSRSISVRNHHFFGVKMKLEVNNDEVLGEWISLNDSGSSSCVWKFIPHVKMEPTDSIVLRLEENGLEYENQHLQPHTQISKKPEFLPALSSSIMDTIRNQLSTCQQLLELEPESKWTLLTSIFLMICIDRLKYETEIMCGLDKLVETDSLRKGYYLDLKSKIAIQLALMAQEKTFELKERSLTCIYHAQYLHQFDRIDLSCNMLASKSLIPLYPLINCRWFNLSENCIDSLETLPHLPQLETLILDSNFIENIDVEDLKKFPMLKEISLKNNPVAKKQDIIKYLTHEFSNISFSVS